MYDRIDYARTPITEKHIGETVVYVPLFPFQLESTEEGILTMLCKDDTGKVVMGCVKTKQSLTKNGVAYAAETLMLKQEHALVRNKIMRVHEYRALAELSSTVKRKKPVGKDLDRKPLQFTHTVRG